MKENDVIIIGAGAAGLFCAATAGKRGRRVTVLDHANKVGKKILMSGGGYCNFTNYHVTAEKFISHNPHFCKSALSRYTQWDFIELVKRYKIDFHEKKLGQLFCDKDAKDIVNMLVTECDQQRVTVKLETSVDQIEKLENGRFLIKTASETYQCQSLVIATGGLSIPTMGASPFGYKVAENFGIKVWPVRAGLVPFTLHQHDKDRFADLSGIAIESIVSNDRIHFAENILFTHRGLSGPAILQISSYWEPGEAVVINLLPTINLIDELKLAKIKTPQQMVKTQLCQYIPKRVVNVLLNESLAVKTLANCSLLEFSLIATLFHQWTVKPNATEGYRTAEVTLGGVDCDALSSKTMEAREVSGLYFIGEVVDVAGWLGGYNFQWAWSSGFVAGQVV